MKFSFDSEKNAKLLTDRGVGFNEIIRAISEDGILAITDHYNKRKYPNQKIMYVRLLNEVYVVPFTQEKDDEIFLKTLFPSRKARKIFLKK